MVLSVLGDPDARAEDFARWAATRCARVISIEGTSHAAAARTVVAGLDSRAMWRTAQRALAVATGRSAEELEAALLARAPGQRARWLARLCADTPPLMAARWILSSMQDRPLDVTTSLLEIEQLVPALAAVSDPLAVLVVPRPGAESLVLATTIAAELAEQLKPHAVALCTARADLDRMFATQRRASVSLARQGMIEVLDAGSPPPARGGRSDVERALFTALEREPRTRGRFTLSHRLAISFHGQPAEVDLYDAELGLAVEIDGWHHFREPAGYRRDRAKDLVLQRAGILVLRVLEEDVQDRLDAVVEQIASLLNDRHRTAASRAAHPR